jgi:hypothetical protein
MQGKRRDTEESVNMAREKLKYRGYQQESCGREESGNESSVRTTRLGDMGDGSMDLVKDRHYK